MLYSTKSAFSNKILPRQIIKSDKIKILILAHCFSDSVHAYGDNLFSDFYEWMNFLGQTSNNTDYDWYVKVHPDFLSSTKEIILQIANRYPKFKFISPEVSHHQIKEEGINFVLTVYGSVGFEYATMGVPVINASINNPHFDFNFNINPISLDEYKKILYNLNKIELYIDKNEIYEFYAINNLISNYNYLFSDFNQIIRNVGGYREIFTSKIFKEWMNYIDETKDNKILSKLKNFVESKSYTLI